MAIVEKAFIMSWIATEEVKSCAMIPDPTIVQRSSAVATASTSIRMAEVSTFTLLDCFRRLYIAVNTR